MNYLMLNRYFNILTFIAVLDMKNDTSALKSVSKCCKKEKYIITNYFLNKCNLLNNIWFF